MQITELQYVFGQKFRICKPYFLILQFSAIFVKHEVLNQNSLFSYSKATNFIQAGPAFAEFYSFDYGNVMLAPS